jgi:glutathione S-transferase
MSLVLHAAKAPTPDFKGIIRDMRPTWLLEELGVEYKRVSRDPMKRETQSPDYLQLHPLGKVPFLEDGKFQLYESAAICEYLADKFAKFTPSFGTDEYYVYRQWNYFAMSNLDPIAARIFGCDFFSKPSDFNTQLRATFSTLVLRFLPLLEKELSAREWMLESGFSVSDILTVTSVCCLKGGQELADFPNLQRYLERAKARPAYQRALNLNGT